MSADSKQPTPAGEKILERLAERSWSIAEIERRTPLTKNTIANAIYGPRQPQRKTIEILATALDLPISQLTRPELAAIDTARFASFDSWLLRWRNPSLWICLAGAALTAFLLRHGLSGGGLSPAVQGLHGLVILVLLLRLPRAWVRPRTWTDATASLRLAAAAASDFRRYWGAAWTCWLFLYLGLTAGAIFGLLPSSEVPYSSASRWLIVGLNLIQNGATVMLLLGYEVLARPTIEADLTRKQVLPTEAWLAFALLLPLLEAAVLGAGLSWQLQQWFGWISGFAQGTALALMVGRLDSKYLEPPTVVVALLYVYAAIQGAWPMFQSHHQLMLVLTFLALVLKCLLFLFVAWLFESQVLLFYLERVRQLDHGVRTERADYLARIQ